MWTFESEIQGNLRAAVEFLSKVIGPRSYLQRESLDRASEYIRNTLERYGYKVSLQKYDANGMTYHNIHTELKGGHVPDKVLVAGAHYDTVSSTPGADDNASGIAVMLEIARLLSLRGSYTTVRFVAFPLEEPPFFRSRFMGSYVYAESLKRKGEDVVGMICLESVGYFSDEPGSQFYPVAFFRWMYPDKGNFIALVSNMNSKNFLNSIKQGFKKGTRLPVESIATLSIIPGIDFSDHRSFWEFGINAIMVTDTAFYRNPNYHTAGDTHDTLDYTRMVEVVKGLVAAIEEFKA
jgi:Zn-dependent M28 family amino/carboxypeptidase